MIENNLVFANEKNVEVIDDDFFWSVLIIDDDPEVHTVTKLALHDFQFDNKKLKLISAYSEKEAIEILQVNNSFVIILLDIVMETSNSGLNIVDFIRNKLNNKFTRIIIRTGQPGYAPEEDIINEYDINDYKEKTELTSTKLYTTTRTALAQYKHLDELEKTKNELYENLIVDSITKLYSREKLYRDLKEYKKVGLILIDIDSFSTINNAYGYPIGDKILKEVAKILLKTNTINNLVYRIESDSFIILLENKTNDELFEFSVKLKNILVDEQYNIDDLTLRLNLSIGISNYPYDMNLLQKAEIALYASRKKQDNKIEFYSEELEIIKIINNNLLWSKRLSKAIVLNNIKSYFQPIVECKTKKIVKYETLVRLVYEDEVYSPIHFLGAARNAGLLTKITKIVFEQACEVFSSNDLDFSVNITDHDLMEKDFSNTLDNFCKKYNILNNRVSLEILEEQSINKNVQAQKNIRELKELGFLLSIDDFGVEYSNFSQLKSLDIDSVKIDGSFIKDINLNQYSEYITQSILFYTKKINVKTVAEFVHSKEVFDEVKNLGINYAQGYYFGKPESKLI
ncbi:MAG: EAL domain-containing protein [Arcobacter sp.]|nr:EAL domain-containing protein [Arcobacter sp.]